MEIGLLAHCVGQHSYKELPRLVGEQGFGYVQLALAKAISDVDTSLGKLSPGLANAIAEEFDRHSVKIPVLGCYINMVDPNEEARRYGIDRFKEHIRMARHFGAAVVDTETGHVSAKYNEEQAWELTRRTVEELLEEAEKWGVIVAVEPANSHIIGTAQDWRRLADEVNSTHLAAVIDPCNILRDKDFHRQDEAMREAFRLLGDRVVLAHSKDLYVDGDGAVREACTGKGTLNYALFTDLLKQYKPHVHVTLESVKPEEMQDAIQYLKRFF
ncbi:MAG: sugar phosphate isomerase/epimerase [Paenibacillaceae bacterium]|jgi:sugar phosphate isomerase/epimerase|nr:sugar phosphate isomerase/epimerase [Paenibacillaceae bacterium]